MLSNKRGGRKGSRARRDVSRCILPILLAMLILFPVQNTHAAVQTTSGTTQLSNTLTVGDTAYSVEYSYPSTAQVGTNLTLTFTVHVDSLTGLVEYLYSYSLVVDVSIGQDVLRGSITSDNGANYLYPGSNWGPNNVTIPLTEGSTGLAKGASTNATVSVTLEDTEWWGAPLSIFQTEPAMQGAAGSLVIQDSVASTTTSSATSQGGGQTQTYLPYALIGSAAILAVLAVFMPDGPRPHQTNRDDGDVRSS
jgi:hypothetical protein